MEERLIKILEPAEVAKLSFFIRKKTMFTADWKPLMWKTEKRMICDFDE